MFCMSKKRKEHYNMTEQEQLVGNLFRESLYTGNSIPEIMELFSSKISQNFTAKDFLLLQMASQLFESAQIRKKAHTYMKMMSKISSECFNLIESKHSELKFCTSQRFKSFFSELYKRYERVQDGLSPEIKDLPALRIILLEENSQKTLRIGYEIAEEIMETFSKLNSDKDFPLYVNLSIPDKSVSQSNFDQSKHPNVLIPDSKILIPKLSNLGKDYIHFPKDEGYQSYHICFELISKSDSSIRIFSEIQIRTIAQHMYAETGPANHREYKIRRTKKLDKIFGFDNKKVHISGYYPATNPKNEFDYSGFLKPTFVTERSKTF